MELVVIEKSAYLRLKQQIEDLSTQIEAVKKKFGSVEKEKMNGCPRSLSGAEYFQAEFAKL